MVSFFSTNIGRYNPLDRQSSTGSVETFDGEGSDFLSPNRILNEVDDFTSGINTITSPGQIVIFADPYDNTADAEEILRDTNRSLDSIFSPSFIKKPNNSGYPGYSEYQPDKYDNWGNTSTNTYIADLANYNPLIWKNPSPTNIMLGTMDSANVVFGGSGLVPRPLAKSPFPLYPFIQKPGIPFQQYSSQQPYGYGKSYRLIDTFKEAQLFPKTFAAGQPLPYYYQPPYAFNGYRNNAFINNNAFNYKPNMGNQAVIQNNTLNNLNILALVN